MRIIAISTIRELKAEYASARGPLDAWRERVARANWHTPQDVKDQIASASILNASRVVFNVGGNNYRLIASIDYTRQAVYIKFFGTHAEYDAVDALTVNDY